MPPSKKKAAYDATFRFRGYSELGKRIARVLEARGYGDDSEFMREAVMKLVIELEKNFGLPRVAEEPPRYGEQTSKPRKARKKS